MLLLILHVTLVFLFITSVFQFIEDLSSSHPVPIFQECLFKLFNGDIGTLTLKFKQCQFKPKAFTTTYSTHDMKCMKPTNKEITPPA